MEMQWLQATGVVLAYILLCWYCLRRGRGAGQKIEGATLLVAYASQSGEAESIARSYADLLEKCQPVTLLPLNQVTEDVLLAAHTALFVASTYGEGEPPDNALRFSRLWVESPSQHQLSSLHYAVLALGDSSYRLFCAFGERLDKALAELGGRRLFDLVRVDCLDQASLGEWHRCLQGSDLLEAGLPVPGAPSSKPETAAISCNLLERTQLNRGSPGGPVFHLRFSQPETASWQAGDIAVLELPDQASGHAETREYSLASLPAQGTLDLVVRQVQKPDGSLGAGSGWLTAQLQPGDSVALRLRDNPAFHTPPNGVPLILVGNGTGIAGLRAHLQARVQCGEPRNWLVFGERTRAHDALFDSELQAWRRSGHLQHLDRVFSREGEEMRYVQDVLATRSAQLQQWFEEGASIYLCGSVEGMAPAVHRVLLDLLGEQALEELTLSGRYRRDVY